MQRTSSSIILVFVVSSIASAQTPSQAVVRTVTVPEVMVRSGPSEKYYPTSKLRKNDKVMVVGQCKENPAWLKIKPPPGSFSWINARFVKKEGKYTAIIVCAEEAPVPVRVGSAVTNKKPNVERWKLKRGTAVVILDKPLHADGSAWLPIEATPGEVRYIPASAVKGSPVETLPEDAPSTEQELQAIVVKADREFNSNSLVNAKRRYLLAAQKTDDYNLKIHCYQRLNVIDKTIERAANNVATPGHPQYSTPQKPAQPMMLTSNSTSRSLSSPISRQAKKTVQTMNASDSRWTSWGQLRRTMHCFQGRRMYALVDSRGNTLTYAVTPPHLTLEPYVGRTISLFGSTNYGSDGYLRAHYVNVAYVALPDQVK